MAHVSHIVDIEATFEAKMEAMRAYASQCTVVSGALQHIEGISLLRGAQAVVKFGEDFLKSIDKRELIL